MNNTKKKFHQNSSIKEVKFAKGFDYFDENSNEIEAVFDFLSKVCVELMISKIPTSTKVQEVYICSTSLGFSAKLFVEKHIFCFV